MKVKFIKLHDRVMTPKYQTIGSSGADIHALLPDVGDTLYPGDTRLYSTGLAVEIPKGYEIQVRSRSGLSQQGIIVLNSPGTIDSDYRGEVCILVANFSKVAKHFFDGDRIAQLVLARSERIQWVEVLELNDTSRGNRGFGSTNR